MKVTLAVNSATKHEGHFWGVNLRVTLAVNLKVTLAVNLKVPSDWALDVTA